MSEKRIILDTNFLLAVFELKIDIFAEIDKTYTTPYKLYILDRTLDEVENLIKTPLLSKKLRAKAVLKLIEAKHIPTIITKDSRSVDDILVDMEGYTIATADKELKERLKKKGRKIISIRQKKHIIVE